MSVIFLHVRVTLSFHMFRCLDFLRKLFHRLHYPCRGDLIVPIMTFLRDVSTTLAVSCREPVFFSYNRQHFSCTIVTHQKHITNNTERLVIVEFETDRFHDNSNLGDLWCLVFLLLLWSLRSRSLNFRWKYPVENRQRFNDTTRTHTPTRIRVFVLQTVLLNWFFDNEKVPYAFGASCVFPKFSMCWEFSRKKFRAPCHTGRPICICIIRVNSVYVILRNWFFIIIRIDNGKVGRRMCTLRITYFPLFTR